ncbi:MULTISPECIES: ATP-binding protein [Asticcacaulis]|uniref:ATP-binding protein n=1 Tax=Asticcacaulis TaxID=76890 RepID=UPI001AE7DE7A|nr:MULTISPECIES: ATP-binding protein [Asticcacaulis]MBP2160427.1 signal transduction histidine kinase [Asticcacaulis solisilvae]MDR6801472.1 signal transduction histidine kinase [Asticcacaulis sp. BE141]
MNPFKRLLVLWSTATFRLAAVFTLIFGVGSAILLLVLNMAVSRFAEQEIRQALQHQMAIMRADVNLEGGAALANVLNEHSLNDDISRYSYYVVAPDGKVFSSGLPAEVARATGFSRIVIPVETADGQPEPGTFMVLTERARDGTFMAVGRDTYSLQQLRDGLNNVALWGGLGLIILAVGAGTTAGMLFLKRLDRVNAVAARLIDSNLSERLPSIGFGSEFDKLAGNLNRMLDRLEAAITAVRQVSADLAHDLRTPLTRLRNRLDEAAATGEPSLINDAIDETDEILRVFNALLRIAQIEGGDVRKTFQKLDLGDIIGRVIEIYQPAAEEGGRILRPDLTGKAMVMGDAALLQQLLTNLVDNALNHTPAGTTVMVSLGHDAGKVVLTVADDGPGVPPPEQAKITKRFYRLDASRGTPGAGLGLPLVVAIADLHKAAFAIEDNAPGLRVKILFNSAP